MGWLEGLAGLAGVGGVVNGIGASSQQNKLQKAQAAMLNAQTQRYNRIQPQVDNAYLGVLASGGKAPYLEAQRRKAEADTNSYWQSALADRLKGLDERGLGNSSMMTNETHNLARARAQSLADARGNELNLQDARVQQALAALGGSAGSIPGQAIAGYGSMAAGYGQQANDAYSSLGALAQLLAQNRRGAGRASSATDPYLETVGNTFWGIK